MKKTFIVAVADDDIDDQDLMKKGLVDAHVEVQVTSVYNGLQLMDYLLKREYYKKSNEIPDLILLDLNMPLMDGYDVLREIREHPHLQAIPVFVITTSRRKEDETKALSLGATGFYTKGSSAREIREIMHRIYNDGIRQIEEKQRATQ